MEFTSSSSLSQDVDFCDASQAKSNPVDAVKRRLFESLQDSNEFPKKAKTTHRPVKPGFCVICEKEGASMTYHLAHEHRTRYPTSPTYEVVDFEGTEIMAFQGTRLQTELAKCPTCFGVFYKHRVENHLCSLLGRRSIDEGTGPEYCLMCQCRTVDIRQHAIEAHGLNNPIYHISMLTMVGSDETFRARSLLPNRDIEGDLAFFGRCACGNCLRVSFKNRVRRICPATEPEL